MGDVEGGHPGCSIAGRDRVATKQITKTVNGEVTLLLVPREWQDRPMVWAILSEWVWGDAENFPKYREWARDALRFGRQGIA